MAGKKTKTTEIKKTKTPAEQMCDRVPSNLKSQAVTLANAVLAMQEKIEQQIPIYMKMPLAQQVTVGTGEKMLRQNPATQEFRATVRDYSTALNNLQEIIGTDNEPQEFDALSDIRSKFKVG